MTYLTLPAELARNCDALFGLDALVGLDLALDGLPRDDTGELVDLDLSGTFRRLDRGLNSPSAYVPHATADFSHFRVLGSVSQDARTLLCTLDRYLALLALKGLFLDVEGPCEDWTGD